MPFGEDLPRDIRMRQEAARPSDEFARTGDDTVVRASRTAEPGARDHAGGECLRLSAGNSKGS